MLPRILAGAVVAATEVAIDRWLAVDSPVLVANLLRQALRQLTDYLRLPSTPARPAVPAKEHQ
jgi:MftR C-terminal domain